jgi:phage tail sheath protein FI
MALYPKQNHCDQLYGININPIKYDANDGFVVFGQKTLQTKPSAFDRINVRRTFLYFEKTVKDVIKYFVFEPNSLFTRNQVMQTLTPLFEFVKTSNPQGIYDYKILCNKTNNTPDVIDNNELVVDIFIQPVRAAEFIQVNFIATRTGENFSELI